MIMIEKGKRIPNWNLTDLEGNSHDVWSYRQKSHLILIYEPETSRTTLQHWKKAVQVDQKQWDWLNTKVVIAAQAPKEVSPGAYVIDRYGIFLNYVSSGQWTFDLLERDLIYYEAKHC